MQIIRTIEDMQNIRENINNILSQYEQIANMSNK